MPEKKPGAEAAERLGRHIPWEAREHARAARAEMRRSIEALFPKEFIEHRRAARQEMLLAARSLIEHALERMEKSQGN
jgi:hypothetical protein